MGVQIGSPHCCSLSGLGFSFLLLFARVSSLSLIYLPSTWGFQFVHTALPARPDLRWLPSTILAWPMLRLPSPRLESSSTLSSSSTRDTLARTASRSEVSAPRLPPHLSAAHRARWRLSRGL